MREALADEPRRRIRRAAATNRGDEPPDVDGDEPESRLILETAPEPERADYLPLFVAPQPVQVDYDSDADDDDEDDDGDDGGPDSDEDQGERPAARRRRRGRRGRGRGRGEQSGDDSDDDDSDDDTTDAKGRRRGFRRRVRRRQRRRGQRGGDAGNRRRRRRRRRKSGSGDDDDSGASPDDPPNTVVHERRAAGQGQADKDKDNGEIQGISGSTRLEAKRQRRRDGRDAGRRRPPILSEAEFLARREAVERTMVVRDKVRTEPPHEGARYTQIAVLEDGVVVEHFVTSAASASLVGNIYLGIVQNVLPSMEAAFVDIGRGRNGVLYAGEVNWEAAGLGGAQPQDRTGPQARRLRRRPGQQGSGRAQGRPADHPGVACRPLPRLRAGRVVDRASAASCPTPNGSGSRRSCARSCRPTPA